MSSLFHHYEGSIVELTAAQIKSKDLYLSLPLTRKEKHFVSILFNEASQDENNICDMATLTKALANSTDPKMPSSKATVNRYYANFKKLGLMVGREISTKGLHGTRTHYTLTDYDQLKEDIDKKFDSRVVDSARKSTGRISLMKKNALAININANRLSHLADVKAITESILMGVTNRCIRRSVHEKVPGNVIVTPFPFKKEVVTITTTTQTGDGEILAMDDMPAFRALLSIICTLIAEQVEAGTPMKEIDNSFLIDLHQITSLMKYKEPSSTSNLYRVYKSLKRLKQTEFKFAVDDPLNSEFNKKFDILSYLNGPENIDQLHAKNLSYRYLGSLDEYTYTDSKGSPLGIRTMDDETFSTVVRLSLHDHTWVRLKNNPVVQAIFRAHDELFGDRNGIMHGIYDYLRAVLYPDPKVERVIDKPLHSFAKSIYPEWDYSAFKRSFFGIIAAKLDLDELDDVVGYGEFLMYGYKFKLWINTDVKAPHHQSDKIYIRVERDIEDYLIGDKASSQYNQRYIDFNNKQKELAQLEEETKLLAKKAAKTAPPETQNAEPVQQELINFD